MNKELILTEIIEILRDILKLKSFQFTENTAPSEIAEWDSLNHLLFIGAVEKKYSIKFKLNDLLKIKNLGNVAEIVSQKLS